MILLLSIFLTVTLSNDKRVNALRREVLIEKRMWVLMRFTEEKSRSTVTDVCGIVSKILSSWWMLGKMSPSAKLKISKRVDSVGIDLLRNDLKTSISHSGIVNPYPPDTLLSSFTSMKSGLDGQNATTTLITPCWSWLNLVCSSPEIWLITRFKKMTRSSAAVPPPAWHLQTKLSYFKLFSQFHAICNYTLMFEFPKLFIHPFN